MIGLNNHEAAAIDQIRGSMGHCREFDAAFRPLGHGTEGRWMRVATKLEAGEPLPAVRLIQVGDVYFAREGHYQISVLRAMGQLWVEAEVEVWQVSGAPAGDEKAMMYHRASGSRADAARAKQAGVV